MKFCPLDAINVSVRNALKKIFQKKNLNERKRHKIFQA